MKDNILSQMKTLVKTESNNLSAINENLQIKPKSFFNKYEHLRITTSKPIDTPIPVISINDSIISTPGNITMLSGESKSGKTALTGAIIAGAIIENDFSSYDGFELLKILPNINRKAVIQIDTEQARHNHYKNFKSILKRVNLSNEPNYFFSYNIRELDLKERQLFIEELFLLCENKCGGVHLAVIDGIADLINSPNDEEESNKIVAFLEKLAIKYNCPIIVIIHFNPKSDKQRGHLGSQLQRKSESVIAIRKNGDTSYIEPQFLRSAGHSDFSLIQFYYDKEKGYHVSNGIYLKEDKESEKIEELEKMAKEIFNYSVPISHSTAIDKIMKLGNVKISTAKNRLKSMLELELISKEGKAGYKLALTPD